MQIDRESYLRSWGWKPPINLRKENEDYYRHKWKLVGPKRENFKSINNKKNLASSFIKNNQVLIHLKILRGILSSIS